MVYRPRLTALAVTCLLLLAGRPGPARGQAWSHVLPVDLYSALSLPQRGHIDRALELHAKGGDGRDKNQQRFYASAVIEWEKFRAQYADTISDQVFAYTLFMQALAQHRALQRHTAIKTYTEVLDYFPEETWVAAPALYHRALAHFDNGDERQGMTDLKAMADHPAYSKHPLAAGALTRLAENYWDNEKLPQALAIWQQIERDFSKVNPDANRTADYRLMLWDVVQANISAALERTMSRDTRTPDGPKKELNATLRLFNEAVGDLNGNYDRLYFSKFNKPDKAKSLRDGVRAKFYDWFLSKQNAFSAAGREWDFLLAVFDYARRYDSGRVEELVVRSAVFLRSAAMSPEQRKSRAVTLINILAGMRRYAEATSLLEFVPAPAERLWILYGFAAAQENVKDQWMLLDQLDALKDPEVTAKVLVTRANLHRQLKEYEQAIKLYHQVNDPPDTLWQIVGCYRSWGKRQQAQDTLTEIASIFPNQAAKAIFTKAEYYRADGEKEMAIGLYRRLLSHPDWKKTGESSKAHDRLEDLGIETGGGEINEVN